MDVVDARAIGRGVVVVVVVVVVEVDVGGV